MTSAKGALTLFIKAFGPRRESKRAAVARPGRKLDVTEREWRRLRAAVFERDGYACVYCQAAPPIELLQADHVVPRARGGKSTLANLVTACGPCNASKRATPLEQWRTRA